MALYKNTKCPVCNELFNDGDDIVTCPVCGTPHHRECYKSINHCANESLHGEGFSFKKNEENNEMNKIFAPSSNKNTEDGAEVAPAFEAKVNDNVERMDGVAVSDISDFVSVNQTRFLNRFRKNKKVSWNWAAFFFGPLYLLYRKMFSQGILCVVMYSVIDLVTSTIFNDELTALAKLMTKAMESQDIEAMMALQSSPEFAAVIPALIIALAGFVIVNIVVAALADSMYKKKIISLIKFIDERISALKDDGMTKMLGIENDLSTAEGRRSYIMSRGGVSPVAPIAFISMAIMYFVMFM